MVCSRPVAQVAIKRKCTKVVLKRSKKETPTQLCQLDSILAWLGRFCFSRWQQEDLDIDDFEDCGGFIQDYQTTVLGVRLSDLIIGQTRKSTFSASSHWPRVAILICPDCFLQTKQLGPWSRAKYVNHRQPLYRWIIWLDPEGIRLAFYDFERGFLYFFYGFLIVNGHCRLELTCLCGNLHKKFRL